VDRSVSSDELFVVPAERHVERLAREGRRAETLSSLRARLVAALLPDVRFADARETKLTLAVALEEAKARGAQLELFGPAPGAGADAADPLLVTLRGRGGASWVRAVAAIDDAIGALRSRGATEAHLERVRGAGVAPARARTLAAAMRALDAALARAGARDGRLVGATLAPAIQEAGPAAVAEIVGALHLRARWLIAWDPQDLAWWRALDETLARAGGDARVVLPAFDKRLEGSRERDPLEVVADVVARHLDAAPETEIIPAVLGDLVLSAPSALAPDAACRVRLARAANARDEARLVARLVRRALDAREARVERVAIAYPARDERTLVPLRRALLDEGVVFHDAAAAPPAAAPVVAAALQALDAAESLDRVAVARLLRSGYVDAPRVLRGADARDAERLLARVARALETRATAAAEDAVARLVLTASGGEREGAEASAATVIVEVLARARAGRAPPRRARARRAPPPREASSTSSGSGRARAGERSAPSRGTTRRPASTAPSAWRSRETCGRGRPWRRRSTFTNRSRNERARRIVRSTRGSFASSSPTCSTDPCDCRARAAPAPSASYRSRIFPATSSICSSSSTRTTACSRATRRRSPSCRTRSSLPWPAPRVGRSRRASRASLRRAISPRLRCARQRPLGS
jgi:hypothetical protein